MTTPLTGWRATVAATINNTPGIPPPIKGQLLSILQQNEAHGAVAPKTVPASVIPRKPPRFQVSKNPISRKTP